MSKLTIPLPEIIVKLAAKVNCNDQTAGSFLKEFSIVIAQGLAADGVVKIDRLGVFRVTADIDGSQTVEFAPESSLAESVNQQFAMFESVDLADSLTDEQLAAAADIPVETQIAENLEDNLEKNDEVAIPPENKQENMEESVSPPPLPDRFMKQQREEASQCPESVSESESRGCVEQSNSILGENIEREVGPASLPNGSLQQEQIASRVNNDSPMSVILEPESQVIIKRIGHSTLTLVITAIAACLLGIVIGYLAYRYANCGLPSNVEVVDGGILIRQNSSNDKNIGVDEAHFSMPTDTAAHATDLTEKPLDNNTAAAVEETPSSVNKIVTDTVRPGNYLSVMARRHYGNAKFWIYIYIENKDIITDPDNLANGMVVIIPPASKYGIDPSDKESLKKAEREAYKAIS